jgi:multiple sugar transport system permease protein
MIGINGKKIKELSPQQRRRKTFFTGLLFVSPWIIGFVLFQLYPIVMSAYYSLTEYNLFNPPEWVGLENYSELFADDKFYLSLYNTVFITIFGLIPQLIFTLVMAVILNMNVKGKSLYRTIYFLPTLVPAIASSLLWMWLFNSQYGLINEFLGSIGLIEPNWLLDPAYTKYAIIIMGFWGTGTNTVMYLAALQGVPRTFYEAAEIDGANRWQKFWHITIPAISPITLYLLIMGLIGSFQIFTQADVLGTQAQSIGGPENSMLFYAVYLYQIGFKFLNYGVASAMAWILFIIVLILTIVIFRSSARWVYYGGEN